MDIKPPIVQLALDYPTIEEALAMAAIGAEAGVDWMEAGTPLIVAQGFPVVGKLKKAFPKFPVLADYKTMDSGGKNVLITQQQGAQVMTVCGGAADETIRAAVAESKKTGVWVVVDTIGVKDPAARAKQCEAWGVNMIYLHYAADQWRADPSKDGVQWVEATLKAVKIPVGVGTFGVEDSVRAVAMGAELVAIGHPVISGKDPLGALTDFVKKVKAAYRPRG